MNHWRWVGPEANNDDGVLDGGVVHPPETPSSGCVVADVRLPNVIGATLRTKAWMTRIGGELIERLSNALGPTRG